MPCVLCLVSLRVCARACACLCSWLRLCPGLGLCLCMSVSVGTRWRHRCRKVPVTRVMRAQYLRRAFPPIVCGICVLCIGVALSGSLSLIPPRECLPLRAPSSVCGSRLVSNPERVEISPVSRSRVSERSLATAPSHRAHAAAHRCNIRHALRSTRVMRMAL
jgi:hypothetical protein